MDSKQWKRVESFPLVLISGFSDGLSELLGKPDPHVFMVSLYEEGGS